MTQYATFRVNDRLYGTDILSVREIIRVFDITPVPRTDGHIRGLINLRGQIVTILDLAVRLGMDRPEITDNSHIVVLKTAAEIGTALSRGSGGPPQGANEPVGLLVDAISDVVEAESGHTEAPPANLNETEERFLSGVVKTDAGLLILLNMHDLLFSH
ncbi:MAG: chemotaxis protein CheW [Acidobacteria bacterium]|nr:chemotaxis protein CheW [Acidobacteriota bacterium]